MALLGAGGGAVDHLADRLAKAARVRLAVDHEVVEHLGRVEADVAVGRDRVLEVDAGVAQGGLEGSAMRAAGHDDRGAPVVQVRPDEVTDGVDEELGRLVELDDVLMLSRKGVRGTDVDRGN